ncbi:MAG: cysteine desulfurase [Pseudomonadota bacterium]|nr:cysteine desulfurase [Pseudomonadota bacterium]
MNQKKSDSKSKFNESLVRKDFPILNKKVNGKKLVYADSAATTQKPTQVIDKINNYYSSQNANVHRGIHALSEEATREFEKSREIIANFINANSSTEIIFTKGATESINLVAQSFGEKFIEKNDEILISTMEHHSNIVPWQILSQRKDAKLKIIPVSDNGEIIIDELEKLVTTRTKIVALNHVSNALGTINPVTKLTKIAKKFGAKVLIDGAQGCVNDLVDVQRIGCDFYVFSGHKALGPTGIGVLYGRQDLLEDMPPWQGGGDMIKKVTFEQTTFNDLPYKFEAGTPNISGAIGLAEALKYLSKIGLTEIITHEKELLEMATKRALEIPNLKIIGQAENKAAIISFIIDDAHPQDIGTLLDQQGVAIRSGHHCVMPLMERFGLEGTARASFCLYNNEEDVNAVFDAVETAAKLLS